MCQHLRSRQCVGRELEAEYSLANHILCERCAGLVRQEAEVVDSECICSGNVFLIGGAV